MNQYLSKTSGEVSAAEPGNRITKPTAQATGKYNSRGKMIKVGDRIASVEILWVGHLLTPGGQRRQYVRFTCGCGQPTQTMHTVALKAKAGRAYLRCVTCQDAGNYAQAKKPKAESKPAAPKAPPVSKMGGKVAATTLAALNALPPSARAIADSIIRRHVQACFELDVPVENFDRVVIEAVEEAKADAPNAPSVVASVPMVEPFRRYSQYTSPKEGMI